MKLRLTGILIACVLLASAATAQNNQRYSEYWQSYSNVEHAHPTGYASDVIEPGWQKAVHVTKVPYNVRQCESPYPEPGVWDRYNNNVANSTYAHWGQNNEPYSCERFLTKSGTCGTACASEASAPVTFASGNASDIYTANTALIDELKAMYCLPSHIIYRLKSRNDAAYNRSRTGGSPAMPGASLERTTLAGINGELVKLRDTCMNGGSR